MNRNADDRGVAGVFGSGRSQTPPAPAACRVETTEVEAIEAGDSLWLRQFERDWTAYLESETHGSPPPVRSQPPIDEGGEMRAATV